MKKLGLSVAIAAAMGLSACGGGGGGSSTPAVSGATVSGTASKGIVVGGLVSAFLFDTNGDPETTAVATAITGTDGKYSLSIPAAHNGKPLYIVVDDNDGAATMKCDIAGGCDNDGDGTPDAAFGETLDLDDGDLTMSAVLPKANATVSINVTPLTTVAAAVAVNAIGTGVTASTIQFAIENANSQVADRFGLASGDVTKIPVVDLTNVTDVAAAGNAETIQAAAINAAIISAVQATEGVGESLTNAISTFATDYVNNGLIDTADETSEAFTDLTEILADAADVINEVETILEDEFGPEGDELNIIADASDAIIADQGALDTTPTNTGDQGTASPTANSENLVQVKAFVEELRELGTAIDTSMVGTGESAQSIETILDAFELQVDAADMASSDDAEAAMEGLAKAAGAIIEVYENVFIVNDELVTPTDQHAGSYLSDDEIPVLVTVTNGVVTLTVDQSALEVALDETLVDVDVMVVGTVTDITLTNNVIETATTESGTLIGSIDIDLSGTSTSGTIDLEVLNGTLTASATASIDETNVDTETGYSKTGDNAAALSNFAFDLDVTMGHNDTLGTDPVSLEGGEMVVLDPMSFTGGLAFTFTNWDVASVYDESNVSKHEEVTVDAGIVSLDLIGTFGNSTESFEMAFGIDVNGTNIPSLTEISDSQDGDSETGEETDQAFATASVTLSFGADLAGVADAVNFSFEINRTGLDDGNASLEISYPGRTITIEAEGSNLDSDLENGLASLTLTNNDGIQISVTADESIVNEDEELTLEIRKDTDGDGDIDSDDFLYGWYEVRNDLDVLVYTDDVEGAEIEFETFF